MSKLSNNQKNKVVVDKGKSIKLEFVKLYKISMSDLAWVIEQMPSAARVLLYLQDRCTANINAIQVRREIIAHGTRLSVKQVSKSNNFLIEHKLITKEQHRGFSYFELNTKYMSTGDERNKVCYYDPTALNAEARKVWYADEVKDISHID